MRITAVRQELFVKHIQCDRCGRIAEQEDVEFTEAACIDLSTGYGSIFGDGNEVQIDLCQHCLKLTLGQWLRVIDPRQKPLMIGHRRPSGEVSEAADECFAEPEDSPDHDPRPIDEERSTTSRLASQEPRTLVPPGNFETSLPQSGPRELQHMIAEAQAVLYAIEGRNDQGICTIADRAEHSVIKNLCRSIRHHMDAIDELNEALARRLLSTKRRLSSEQ